MLVSRSHANLGTREPVYVTSRVYWLFGPLYVPYTVDANRTLRALRPIVVLGIYINTSLRNRPTRGARNSLGNIMYEKRNMNVCNINGIQ